jgi:hypothetical protein
MQGIERHDGIADAKLLEKLLNSRDFIGLFVNFGMGQNQGRIGSESAQNLPRTPIVKSIKALPKSFTVQSHAAATPPIKISRMSPKDFLDLVRFEPLQNIANGRMDRRSFPLNSKRLVEPHPVHFHKSSYPSIRIRAAHNGQDGKQQNVRQLIELAFGTARIRDLGQSGQQRFTGILHDNLQEVGCQTWIQTFSRPDISFFVATLMRYNLLLGRLSIGYL